MLRSSHLLVHPQRLQLREHLHRDDTRADLQAQIAHRHASPTGQRIAPYLAQRLEAEVEIAEAAPPSRRSWPSRPVCSGRFEMLYSVSKVPPRCTSSVLPSCHRPTEGVIDMTANESNPPEQEAGKPKLLAGGNPQIPKGDGDPPVQAYIEAMPGWKRDIGRQLDSLIERNVPDVRKGVRWNSPFYGVEGRGWFLSYHCYTKYVKVTFFKGSSLDPIPPGESKHEEVRYLDIYEEDELDEELLGSWIRQAAAVPGWTP